MANAPLSFLDNLLYAGKNAINSAVQTVEKNPVVQDVVNSPLGVIIQAMNGNPQKINQLPQSLKNTWDNMANGKTQIAWGLDMAPVEGAFDTVAARGAKNPVQITLKPSVYGAQREAQVQSTLDTVVNGINATQKYANLQGAMDSLGNKISNIMSNDPKTASIDTIMQHYDRNLNSQGIYRTTNASRDVVNTTARRYITQLYNGARNTTSDVAPTSISDAELYSLKQNINKDAQSIYRKIENGTSLTQKDKVILAARQTVDDTLSQLHPDVKDATTMQSHLYDAADPLYKLRAKEMATPIQPKQGALQKFMSNRLVQDTALGGGALALWNHNTVVPAAVMGIQGAYGAISDALSGKKANLSQSSSPTPVNGNIPDKYGATISDPIKSGLLINGNDAANYISDLQKKIGAEAKTNPLQASTDQGLVSAMQTKLDSQQTLREAWTNKEGTGVSQAISAGNQAYANVNAADPGLDNALVNGYTSLKTASNGKYASLYQSLDSLSKATGIDFSSYKTKDSLMHAIDGAMVWTKNNWTRQVQGFYGTATTSQGVPQGPVGGGQGAVPQGPAVQPLQQAIPAGFNFKQL